MQCQISRLGTAVAVLTSSFLFVGRSLASTADNVVVPTTDGTVVSVTWTGVSPAGSAGGANKCPPSSGASNPIQDHHVVNLWVPAGAYNSVNVAAEFRIDFDVAAGDDLVLSLYKNGTDIGDSDTSGAESVSKANPAAGAFDVVVCSFLTTTPTGRPYTGKLILKATAKATNGPKDTDGDGVDDKWDLCPMTAAGTAVDADGCPLQSTTGLAPRFQIHPSPPALGNDAGEPSIGFNPFTKRTMFISYTTALRETYPELDRVRKDVAGNPLPQSCDALWQDQPGTLTTLNSLDPILFTDQATGRTFNSQLSGDNSLMEYTEDDGDHWTPAQAGPPNGGADHQTVATGVYSGTPPPTASWPATGPKRAVYYCSQSVATAFCSRSDDGGRTFGQGNPFKDADCAAGALHGHVKVAPDGTVYVPDSTQCVLATGGTAKHVVAFRSTDNGLTFTAKQIPQSKSGDGSDPSIGIATDGTLYMCYVDADTSVHMTVSKDKGNTWINDRNIGTGKGVVDSRFPQAIAGDPDRASCAFLGTSTPGNGNSLDFHGAWYGFQSTTYDGGLTYHVVNVTPRDPIQGWGGVGPSGINRNLLDFNDLQLDEQGRTLFAFADGCIAGCVKDPSANAFASKATVVRQTGGRTLYARYDDLSGQTTATPRHNTTTPLKPAAACARDDLSKRSPLFSNVVWNAPDTGGSPITQYTIYRSLVPDSGFATIGTTAGQTSYQDTSTNASVEKYYYKVEAENAQGKAPVGNVIELKVSTDVVDTCRIPGETIMVDAVGDSTAGEPDMDIVSVSVAEPKAFAGNFVVTEKIANFTAGQPPPSAFYPILFLNNTFFGLDAAQGFEYGTYQDVGQGVLQFTKVGALDPRSNAKADGTITYVVPASFFGKNPGDVIAGWDVRARQGSQSATSRDTAGPSDYTIRGTGLCPDVGAVVLASLVATPLEGISPLDVTFTVSGTPSTGKKLDTYTIDFGEPGGTPQSGSFNSVGSVTLTHRYARPGVYRARLTVTDVTGTASNAVEQTITVLQPASASTPANNRLGGAFPASNLLLMGLLAAISRKNRSAKNGARRAGQTRVFLPVEIRAGDHYSEHITEAPFMLVGGAGSAAHTVLVSGCSNMSCQPLRFGAVSIALLSLSLAISSPVFATTPPSYDVTLPTTAGQVVIKEWTGTSPAGSAGGGSTCPVAGSPTEDAILINLTVPAGAYDTVDVKADFHVEWKKETGSDLVLTLRKDGVKIADHDGGTPEENVSVNNPAAAKYQAAVCSFLATANTPFSGRLTLTATAKRGTLPPSPDVDGDGVLNENDICPDTKPGTPVDADGCPLPTASGLPPRFQIHPSPAALGNSAGEPSVGFNKFTGRTMFISLTQALRETYQENVNPPLLPASCDATWEDKSGTLTQVNSLDPILFTDEATGRTFNSQLSGDNSLLEYTDNDGTSWTPGQAGPPNGGADHQTIATGVYPPGKVPPTASWPPTGPKRAVYYCSQSVATAFCSRSDDGGRSFGPGFAFKDPDCAAGALHGHVKVAPDGTAYVPDSSQCVLPTGGTANHVVAFVSEDAGQTWAAKAIPQSTGGEASDPSVGIASDGTLYMCYPNADATMHVAWSSDKGKTWQGGVDIGAPQGIVQGRFPQAIAGDPDRAACAFLGTTTPGNGYSLAFQGVWYGYVATTYDHGANWHLANVTPHDPVQGYGGIGTSGTNRNLLDFNDLQIDDQGRTLFAFADGCIGGCVNDPSANSFARKATIVRQTGGRTLFAKFDDTSTANPVPRYNVSSPILPAAACARQDISTRSPVQAIVKWNAPDTGGGRITNYKVYRALDAAGPFTLLGSAGTQTSYVDTTTSPDVPKYYYRVEAVNALGVAPVSNIIELVVSVKTVDTCHVPGDVIILDAKGDGVTDDTDIIYLGVAETQEKPDAFTITEKIAKFTSGAPPADSFYPILFPTKGNLYIATDTTQGPTKFTYGTYQDVSSGVLSFTEKGLLGSGSGFKPDGTITLIVPRSIFGSPAVGAVISGFDARARLGGQSATSRDTAGPGDYTVRGTAVCVPPPVVLADLKASKVGGKAPLDVVFTISGTPPDGAALDTFALLFGDERGASPPPYTGNFNGAGAVQVPHRYIAEGTYRATVTVKDTAGRTSTNLAEQTITVSAADPLAPPAAISNNRLGGALSPLALLVMGGMAALRRRRRAQGSSAD